MVKMPIFDRVYPKLPLWGQNAAVTIYGLYWNWLRFGPGFNQFAKEFAAKDKFSNEEWTEWQKGAIQKILLHASNNVPFYRDTFTEDEKEAARNGNLALLPLLEKNSLRINARQFIRDDIIENDFEFFTSGTTGTPISSIWTVAEIRQSLALREIRSANWAGISFKMARATFSGRIAVPDANSRGPFHRYNAVEKQVYFSAFHLKPENATKYVEALFKHNVVWMTGYAVSFYLLAKFIMDQKLKVPPLKAVITTSEKLTDEMRNVMSQAYGCRIFEEYSTVENAIFASECEFGSLHLSPDAAAVEILRPDGTKCDFGEVGEVVVTGLMRYHQPLIRFRLGDLAVISTKKCDCGRSMPVMEEIVGRIEDVVVGPDGRQMVRFHGIFVHQPNIIEGQIIQENLNLINVKVIPTNSYTEQDSIDLIKRVKLRLGSEVHVNVELVDSIPRTKAGKFKSVISKVQQKQL